MLGTNLLSKVGVLPAELGHLWLLKQEIANLKDAGKR